MDTQKNKEYELRKKLYLKNQKKFKINEENDYIKEELFSNEKYNHQLFFLDEKVEEVKQYFIKLNKVVINNNNNSKDHFNKNNYDYEELAQKISVITNNSKHYNSIRAMIKTDGALMVIVALLFKGFSWTNEILNDFNIDYKIYVTNTIYTLKKLDLLISDDGISLNPILFDAIKQSKGSHFRKSLHQAKIYFINPSFIKFCETLTDLFEHKIKTSANFKHSLTKTIAHSDIFNSKMDKVLYEEKTFSIRKHQSEEGIPYITNTLKTKSFLKTLTLSKKDNKDLVLGDNKSKSIAILQDDKDIKKFKKSGRATIEYNNKKLTEEEYNNIMLKNKEDDKDIAKCKTFKGDSRITNQIPRDIHGNEIKSMFLSKKEADKWVEPVKSENDKALDFLDSLEVCKDE